MTTIRVTNSFGDSLLFEYQSSPFSFIALRGGDGLDNTVNILKAPFQDGGTRIDSQLEERYMTLVLGVDGASLIEIERLKNQLNKLFSPKAAPIVIEHSNGNNTLTIKTDVERLPYYDQVVGTYLRANIDLVAPSPYWQDINPTNIKLEDYVAGFRFPFHFPVRFATRGDTRVLVNEGHAPAPVKITFRGESVNPKITKTNTGEFIKVNRTIPSGYSLVITTDFNEKAVRIVAPDGVVTNAMGYIDLNSTFFSLNIGENNVSFLTEGGKPDVYIEYRNLYLGI